jgi:hypothetical protein
MSEASRVVAAQLDPAARVKVGDTLIVQSAGDGLVVSDGLRSIGRIANPTSEMTTAVRDSGGYARGELRRVGLFGDTAEIVVK